MSDGETFLFHLADWFFLLRNIVPGCVLFGCIFLLADSMDRYSSSYILHQTEESGVQRYF